MPAFDPMDYQPYLQQIDKRPAIPKFANAAPKSKAEAPVSKGRRQADAGTEEKGRQSLQSKPQCEEGEILRQGECIKIEKPEPQEFTIGGKYLPPLESAQQPQQSQRQPQSQRCSPSRLRTGCSS